MGPRLVRSAVLVVCALGVAGMIVASALDANGAALTFGLVTVGASVCLIVVTAVSGDSLEGDEWGTRVEALISGLVAGGADEAAVRDLVREVRKGRGRIRRP